MHDNRLGTWVGTLPDQATAYLNNINNLDMAERVGFEPTVRFPAHTLSKRAP